MDTEYVKPGINFFNDDNKNNRISKKQEKKIARTGEHGKRPPGSGNKSIKGDVIKVSHKQGFSGRKYEAKVTDKKQIIVKQEWLEKITYQANAVRNEPVFVLGFNSSTVLGENWGAVPLSRLEELFEIEAKYREE